jgi:hypothetical protein
MPALGRGMQNVPKTPALTVLGNIFRMRASQFGQCELPILPKSVVFSAACSLAWARRA